MRSFTAVALVLIVACSGQHPQVAQKPLSSPATAVTVPVVTSSAFAPPPSQTTYPSPSPLPTAKTIANGGVVEYAIPGERYVRGGACLACGESSLGGMTAGPDGNVWFFDIGLQTVGRVTPAGTITQWKVPGTGSGSRAITAGWDGNLWMVARNPSTNGDDWILRVTPQGQLTPFALGHTGPESITVGPDGNIWFTEFWAHAIGRITPDGSVTTIPIPSQEPRGIVTGPDHNLWFVEADPGRTAIARLGLDGSLKEYLIGGSMTDQLQPSQIVVGRDSNLWFTELGGIGRLTTSGELTQFALPPSSHQAGDITVGPDGNLWFTDPSTDAIGRLTRSGSFRFFPLPRGGSSPQGIAAGVDGRLWFAEGGAATIGSIGVTVPEAAASARVLRGGGTVQVTNSGDGPLAVGSVRLAGVDPASFIVTHDSCAGASLSPGRNCQIEIAFAATGNQSLRSALLQLSDNATGSPQIVQLVGNPPACRLPVGVAGPGGLQQGAFLDVASGIISPAEGGGFEGSAASGVRSTALPVLPGSGGLHYDRQAGRWLPTSGDASVSPDGSRYTYATFVNNSIQLHIVDVATGADRVLGLPAGFWSVVAYTAKGIYLHQSYEGIGPGLTLVDPDTGAITTLAAGLTVEALDGTTAWVATRNPQDPNPGPPGIGASYNEIDAEDLATGVTVPWLYLPGTGLWVTSVANGMPFVSAGDGQTNDLWVVPTANQGVRVRLPFSRAAYPAVGGFVGDASGVWLGASEGIYLWTQRTGAVLVSEAAAAPAGGCA